MAKGNIKVEVESRHEKGVFAKAVVDLEPYPAKPATEPVMEQCWDLQQLRTIVKIEQSVTEQNFLPFKRSG